MEIQEITQKLDSLPQEIEDKGEELVNSRKAYEEAKASFEYKFSEIYLSVKAINPDATQGDLTANAKIGSNIARLDMILKKSEYERKKKELQRLRDNFDALLEESYNWRASVKTFR